ncbi:hypothetical protein ADUPG1_006578 [Aduncisulcus paluster]|uniref:Uncharacterized protein n=1 Tax=Aduncisulcus paluster TaxID=2918883 RepID=A0ABQ5KNA7_9EUKA|nr:hypothetical protein ADUPG1_006578 [Aduncisulcus paluster]
MSEEIDVKEVAVSVRNMDIQKSDEKSTISHFLASIAAVTTEDTIQLNHTVRKNLDDKYLQHVKISLFDRNPYSLGSYYEFFQSLFSGITIQSASFDKYLCFYHSILSLMDITKPGSEDKLSSAELQKIVINYALKSHEKLGIKSPDAVFKLLSRLFQGFAENEEIWACSMLLKTPIVVFTNFDRKLTVDWFNPQFRGDDESGDNSLFLYLEGNHFSPIFVPISSTSDGSGMHPQRKQLLQFVDKYYYYTCINGEHEFEHIDNPLPESTSQPIAEGQADKVSNSVMELEELISTMKVEDLDNSTSTYNSSLVVKSKEKENGKTSSTLSSFLDSQKSTHFDFDKKRKIGKDSIILESKKLQSNIEIAYVMTGETRYYAFYIIKYRDYAAIIDSGFGADISKKLTTETILKKYLENVKYLEYYETHDHFDHSYFRACINELLEGKNGRKIVHTKYELDPESHKAFVISTCQQQGFLYHEKFDGAKFNEAITKLSKKPTKKRCSIGDCFSVLKRSKIDDDTFYCPFDITLFIPGPHEKEPEMNENSIGILFSMDHKGINSQDFIKTISRVDIGVLSLDLESKSHHETISPQTQPFTAFFTGDLCHTGGVISVPSGMTSEDKKSSDFVEDWKSFSRYEVFRGIRQRGAVELKIILTNHKFLNISEDQQERSLELGNELDHALCQFPVVVYVQNCHTTTHKIYSFRNGRVGNLNYYFCDVLNLLNQFFVPILGFKKIDEDEFVSNNDKKAFSEMKLILEFFDRVYSGEVVGFEVK